MALTGDRQQDNNAAKQFYSVAAWYRQARRSEGAILNVSGASALTERSRDDGD